MDLLRYAVCVSVDFFVTVFGYETVQRYKGNSLLATVRLTIWAHLRIDVLERKNRIQDSIANVHRDMRYGIVYVCNGIKGI